MTSFQKLTIPMSLSSLLETLLGMFPLSHFQVFFCFPFYYICLSLPIYIHRATTHSDLVVRAKKMGIDVEIVHNASVMNAIGICGLQLYRYGETVSIPFFTDTWRPDSFYEKIQRNQIMGLHTLCLLGDSFVCCYKCLCLYIYHSHFYRIPA